MRTPIVIAFAIASGFLVQSASEAQFKGGTKGAKGWLPSLEAGKVQAQASGKPMMVVLRCVP
jgi:hypothetical protein